MIKALKELAKDSLTYGFASMLSKIIGFLLLPLYTTHLTPVDYGIVAMLSFVYLFFVPMASMGINNAIFRRYNLSKDYKKQIVSLSTGSLFVFLTSLIYLILGLICAGFLTIQLTDDIKYLNLIYITLGGCFFASVGMAFTIVLRAKRKVITLSITRIIELVFTLSLTIYLVIILKIGVYGVVWANALGACLLAIIQIIICRNDIKFIFDFKELKALLQYGLPFLPHRLLGNSINFLGQFLIKEYGGLANAGLYNIALKFALPLSFIIGAIQNAWVPIKYQMHRDIENEKERQNTFRQLISVYFLFISILFVGTISFSPELLRIVTNATYHDAAVLFPLVLLIAYGQGIYFMSGTGFEFTDNTKPYPLVSVLGVLSLAVIAFTTVNWIGIYGALLGMLVCWFVMAYVVRRLSITRFFVPFNNRIIFISVVLSFISAILIYLSQNYFGITTRLIVAFIISVVFISILLSIFVVDKDFKSLDLNKYPILGKFTTIILRSKNFLIKKLDKR